MRAAIIAGTLAQRGIQWTLADEGPDTLLATGVVRGKHTVKVAIRYSRERFSVAYRDSINMNYGVDDGVREIHPNYNKWIQGLVASISASLSRL